MALLRPEKAVYYILFHVLEEKTLTFQRHFRLRIAYDNEKGISKLSHRKIREK